MVSRILDAATAREFTGAIRQFQQDIHEEWHRDTYTCWTVNRSAGWADSTSVEAQEKTSSGAGKLYASGVGGPQSGEMVVYLESPYRFRTLATAEIETGNLLVINGDRLFRVDIAKREHVDDQLMDVYLTELFTTPMPEGAP